MNKKKFTKEDVQRGRRLKAVREMNHLTQEELAELLNISVSMVKKLESGENNLTIEELRRLWEELGVSSDFILFGEVSDNLHLEYSFGSASSEEKMKILLKILSHLCGQENEKYSELIGKIEKCL